MCREWSHCHTQSHSHTVTQSHCPDCLTVTQSHCHTVTLSHGIISFTYNSHSPFFTDASSTFFYILYYIVALAEKPKYCSVHPMLMDYLWRNEVYLSIYLISKVSGPSFHYWCLGPVPVSIIDVWDQIITQINIKVIWSQTSIMETGTSPRDPFQITGTR